MRQWLTVLTLAMTVAVTQAQNLTVRWLSFDASGGTPQPIRINNAFVDSRFPSVTADGTRAVFQVGSGGAAQIWEAVFNANANQWQSAFVAVPGTTQPLLGLHPVVSADSHYIAFASDQPYGGLTATNSKQQIYVLDRLQNRIVPISVLWRDSDGDGVRDTYEASSGNCIPVAVSADGRVVVFLAQSPQSLNIVDADGNGVADTVSNPPEGWLVFVHDRDADGNGVYDEAGIGGTRTLIASVDNNGNYLVVGSVSVAANGRRIAFATPDSNNPEDWRIFVRDWQTGSGDVLRDISGNPVSAFAPSLSDDGTYLAYLQLTNPTNETPPPPYLRAPAELVVRQLFDPATGQPLASVRELRLSLVTLDANRQPIPPQPGAMDGTVGYGYSDWWGAASVAVDPNNSNVVYVAFHSWSSDLVDLTLARNDLVLEPSNPPQPNDRLKAYKGVPHIFLARFDFGNWNDNDPNSPYAPNRVRLWRLTEWTDQQVQDKQRGLPVSLQLVSTNPLQYRLPFGANLLPTVSFVQTGAQGNRSVVVVFQSLVPFDQNDANGLWDIYLATVPLP
ncbi:hypothetical protein HRbin17_00671 [bacterium HR17]|uniref:Protein TolB n=1 Tax=Candidatus Fervidibacter japonicus TaxID=2035412 RepID=A0A2H5XAJ0_9BACT|nr:hypothetical protein HRbin17_00671 [bacterium HR17]